MPALYLPACKVSTELHKHKGEAADAVDTRTRLEKEGKEYRMEVEAERALRHKMHLEEVQRLQTSLDNMMQHLEKERHNLPETHQKLMKEAVTPHPSPLTPRHPSPSSPSS